MSILAERARLKPIREEFQVLEIDGNDVEIDYESVDMIKFFNNIGLKTKMCCQGHINVDGGRNSFFITFDKSVRDEQMLEFLKTVGEWRQIYPSIDRESGKVKVSNIKRGLNGWVYKRHYFINDKHIEAWVYESVSTSPEKAIYEARRDYMIMDLVYNSKPGELEELYSKYEEKANRVIDKYSGR